MNLRVVSCENPLKIVRPNGRSLVVPCRECNTCRLSHANSWLSRLEVERKCWRYCAFVTLTYNNYYLPRLGFTLEDTGIDPNLSTYTGKDTLRLEDNSCFEFGVSHRRKYYYRRNTFEVSLSSLDGKSLQFLYNNTSVPYFPVQDMQKFIKRVRSSVVELHRNVELYNKYNLDNEKFDFYRTVRYYFSTEYGPTTLRPHCHGLFFFSSPLTAAYLEEILAKCWPFGDWSAGRCSFEYVSSSAASYVSRYVTALDSLPSLFKCKEIKPRAFFSRFPAIGTLETDEEEIREIFHSTAISCPRWSSAEKTFVDVPLYKVFENRLFPRISGFAALSSLDRVRLYSITRTIRPDDYEEFEELVMQLKYCTNLYNPFYNYFSYLTNGFCNRRPLRRFYYQIRRVSLQSYSFGVDIDDYVSHIELYYKKKALKALRDLHIAARDYSFGAPAYKQLVFYTEFIRDIYDIPYDALTWQLDVLDFYGVPRFSSNEEKESWLHDNGLIYSETPSYKSLVSSSREYIRRSTKIKQKNEYLSLHPEFKRMNFGY